MLKWKDIIEIDSRFQKSVHILLDFQNEEKLNSYIPTQSSVAILKQYVETVLYNKPNKATVLIGPYGKGKSHLLLVLLALLSGRLPKPAAERISKAAGEGETWLKSLAKSKKKFLPVVVSAGTQSLNHSFLIALNEALIREGLEALIPDSYFYEAKKVIEKWQREYPLTFKCFAALLEERRLAVESFQKRLGNCDEASLELFKELYPKLTSGSSFSPLLQTEMLQVYDEVNRKLEMQYQYSGIYIVFDEFSKFIEGEEQAAFAKDMKLLQDMCELAGKSEERQLHITFVAHKSIREYGRALSQEMLNTFKGVEGRLTEVMFLVSSRNHYELIENVIKKKEPEFSKQVTPYLEAEKAAFRLPVFRSLFQKEEFEKTVLRGCFPLTPVAACILLNLCEKAAQNERTVFTFLTDERPGGLLAFMEEGAVYAGAQCIYDYFSSVFRKEGEASVFHREWLKAEYALSKADSKEEKMLLKTLALLRMLRQEELKATNQTLRMGTGMEEAEFKKAMAGLENKQLVFWRVREEAYAFRNQAGIDLEKELDLKLKLNYQKIPTGDTIREVSELTCAFPKRYNQLFRMTRYFEYEFMEVQEFFKLKKAEYLFEDRFSDGKLIALIQEEEAEPEKIAEQVKYLKEERIVVLLPKRKFTQKENLKKFLAVRSLLSEEGFIEENRELERELRLYEEDLRFEINAALERDFLPENQGCRIFHLNKSSIGCEQRTTFNRLLSEICEDYYSSAPIINYELINKQNLSAPMEKARNKVIEAILAESDMSGFYEGNASEAAVFRAVLLRTGVWDREVEPEPGMKKLLEEIAVFMKACEGSRKSFARLYEILMGKGYGVRKGVIPILLASQFMKQQDIPVIYQKGRELEISAAVLSGINESPGQYELYIEKDSVKKEQYLSGLEALFGMELEAPSHKNIRLAFLAASIGRYYRSLPQYSAVFEDGSLQQVKPERIKELKKLRKLMRRAEENPREMLFEGIPEIFSEASGFAEILKRLAELKELLDRQMDFVYQAVVSGTEEAFGGADTDRLYQRVIKFYNQLEKETGVFFQEGRKKQLIHYIRQPDSHEDIKIAEEIAKIVTGLYMEDWNDQLLSSYFSELNQLLCEIKSAGDGEKEKDGSIQHIAFTDRSGKETERFFVRNQTESSSYFLKNALEGVLEEFGAAVEIGEKAGILIELLEEMLS